MRYPRAFIATLSLVATSLSSFAEEKPNIILMVADDLGYGDLSCYGAKLIATPRLDALAKQGLRFTDAHSYSGICMPSRYTLLSGRYAFRARRSMDYACNFDEGQVLLPGLLKKSGYKTAMLGKWHNGFGTEKEVNWNAELKPGPLEFGFDSFFGTPRTHSEPPLVYVKGHQIVGLDPADPISVDHSPGTGAHGKQIGGKKAMELRPDAKIDLVMAAEAEKFLSTQTSATPFFLYLAWQAPHNPINPSPEFKGKSKAGIYGDYIQQLDHCVGRVLDALDQAKLTKNTIVIFTSDNGGRFEGRALRAGHRPNAQLLGQKTDVWEGGHRVPFLVRWPSRIITAGERKQFFHHVDVMSTLAAACKSTMPEGAAPDSIACLTDWLDDKKSAPTRKEAILHGTRSMALRSDQWLYIPVQGSGGKTVPEPTKPWSMHWKDMAMLNSDVNERGQIKPDSQKEQLYDLTLDLSQSTNLASKQPEVLLKLRQRFASLTSLKK